MNKLKVIQKKYQKLNPLSIYITGTHKKDWKKFKSNNKSTDLKILYVRYNNEQIRHVYISKRNSTRENQVILLMITDSKKWHYFAVKKISALFCKITSKHDGDFYCLNCFHSLSKENKLKEHENICKNYHYYYIEIPKKITY